MRKTFKHLAMAALATALIAGSATTAFAFKDDSNNGPGSGKTSEVSLQAPGDGNSSQSQDNSASQNILVEDSSQAADNTQSEASQTTDTTDNTTAAETTTTDTSAQVPVNQAFLHLLVSQALRRQREALMICSRV